MVHYLPLQPASHVVVGGPRPDGAAWAAVPCQGAWPQPLQFTDAGCCGMGQQTWTLVAVAVPVEEFAEPTNWDSDSTPYEGQPEDLAAAAVSAGAARRRRRKKLSEAMAAAAAANSDSTDRDEAPGAAGHEAAAAAAGAASGSEQPCAVLEDEEWCGQLAAGLEAGGAAAAQALLALRGSVWQLAQCRVGCRVVQKALEVVGGRAAPEFLQELHGHVLEAMGSPHANYVIQKIVEVMPSSQIFFVAEELVGTAAAAACHRYGCRILCRIFEHSPRDAPATAALSEEILAEAAKLSRHSFAHHVVESVLEHGLPHQRERVAAALQQDLARGARNRNASHVIETALKYCSVNVQKAFSEELLGDMDDVLQLAQSQFGAYVVRALLQLGQPRAAQVMQHLRTRKEELQATKHGRRLVEALWPALAAPPSPSAAAAA